MDVSSILNTNANTATAAQGAAAARQTGEQTLSSSDFLELLITQMTNQDPLDPMSDQEWMAQMAQFSSLEEMSAMNASIQQFTQTQQSTAASAYLGREVSIKTEDGAETTGTVDTVKTDAQNNIVVGINGAYFPQSSIQSIHQAGTGSGA